MKKSASSALLLKVLLISLTVYYCSGWTYKDQDSWPGICQTGKRQSPIALSRENSTEKRFSRINFSSGLVILYAINATNSENRIQLSVFHLNRDFFIQEDNLDGVYYFSKLYLHWPAQHVIDGVRYPFSFEFVFFAEKYSNVENAAKHKDGFASLIVLFEIGEMNDSFKALVEAAPQLKTPNKIVPLKGGQRFYKWIPMQLPQYFRYEGSTMVPGCEENVIYYVFDTPLTLSKDQLEKLTAITDDTSTSRNLQELNGREVYYLPMTNVPPTF